MIYLDLIKILNNMVSCKYVLIYAIFCKSYMICSEDHHWVGVK